MSSFKFHPLSLASAVRGKGIVLCLKVFFFAVRDFVVELVSVVDFLRLSALKILLKKGNLFLMDTNTCLQAGSDLVSDSLGRKGALHVI
jgi:hypothetical protein